MTAKICGFTNEIIGRSKLKSSNIPKRIIVDNIETYDKTIV